MIMIYDFLSRGNENNESNRRPIWCLFYLVELVGKEVLYRERLQLL